MLEFVADHGLVIPDPVERRFAGVGADRNSTVGVGQERTVRRQVLVDLAVKAVALRAGQHGEAGVGGRLPREARRYEIALLLVLVDKRVAFARQADEAIEKFAILVDGTGDIEGPLNPIEAACLCLDLAALLSGRALAHHIENAAGRRLAVNARRRSLENLDSFEPVRLCPRLSELDRRIVRQAQAVKITRCDKATDLDLGVEHGRRAVQLALRARRIPNRLGDALRPLLLDLLPRYDSDGLRRFENRRVGLGSGCALPRDNPVNRAVGAFSRGTATGVLFHHLLPGGCRDLPRRALRPCGPSRRLGWTNRLRLRCIDRDWRQRLAGLRVNRPDLHAQPEYGYAEERLRRRAPRRRLYTITHRSLTPLTNPHSREIRFDFWVPLRVRKKPLIVCRHSPSSGVGTSPPVSASVAQPPSRRPATLECGDVRTVRRAGSCSARSQNAGETPWKNSPGWHSPRHRPPR